MIGVRRPGRVASIVRWGLIALVATVLTVPAVLPVIGLRLLVVDGGSMSPTYRVGDIIALSPPTGDDLRIGTVVSIGDGSTRYVHRVVAVSDDGRATLRGDANAVSDPQQVSQSDVTGVVKGHIDGLTAAVLGMITSVAGRIALALTLTSLVIVTLLTRASSARPPARKHENHP